MCRRAVSISRCCGMVWGTQALAWLVTFTGGRLRMASSRAEPNLRSHSAAQEGSEEPEEELYRVHRTCQR